MVFKKKEKKKKKKDDTADWESTILFHTIV